MLKIAASTEAVPEHPLVAVIIKKCRFENLAVDQVIELLALSDVLRNKVNGTGNR